MVLVTSLFFLSGCPTSNNDDGGSSTIDGDNNNINDYTDLEEYQWHLVNTGQSAFASKSGTTGEDINQAATHAEGLTGNGVIVAVVDTGMEIAHADLDGNVVASGSWDFVYSDTDPTSTATDGDHGTSVAGLIAAEDNQAGGRGVAPGVSLKGFNFLSSDQYLSQGIDALGGSSTQPASDDVFIFNMSYGTAAADDYTINSTFKAHLEWAVQNLRNRKGAIYVKSAGNGFENFGSSESLGDTFYKTHCVKAYNNGLSCQNTSMDPTGATPWIINVAALDATGVRSSYSTGGSANWISAPGGEYGYDESLGWTSSNTATFEPAMVTTDQTGCDKGYSTSSTTYNRFEYNNNGKNYNCAYTSTFNGTSSAAPVISGVIALILEANPNLTWRDVKHILAKTARKVNSTHTGVTVSVNGQDYAANLGWVTNGASYDYHNWYGFGAVDVDDAVTMAKTYSSNWGTDVSSDQAGSGTLNLSIPDNNKAGVTNTLNMTSNITIEAVQVAISVSHTWLGDIGIELQSPAGTKSILFNIFNGFYSNDHLNNMVLLSNAFYGEDASGDWMVRVIDAASSDTGTLTDWTLKVYGH
ncbi:S8 family serine peptidase [bacterium]|nr:S8 family serine peptidase [bacterium]